ncbi:MAG: hypothetical protein EWV80_02435 [Microcystis aeruginosa Ma_QC_B_20070730_S2]|uniref:Uncharacterized protein n=1 Tax=Microcystis aeruginosa Ma_QC_B_20070730_S2 TaxID=2486256 RepID=A0A552E7B8_MICAE|nr:MAG: hypothetical protein EWV80_02435 [Microcystis aeruginosa Ma_QC_B_20070730_S2]
MREIPTGSSGQSEPRLLSKRDPVIALFTLVRYRQVLQTKGLSSLPIPHSDENSYITTFALAFFVFKSPI